MLYLVQLTEMTYGCIFLIFKRKRLIINIANNFLYSDQKPLRLKIHRENDDKITLYIYWFV